MGYTVGEFVDNNIPYNYFLFVNNTHELIVDAKAQIFKFQPLTNQVDGSPDSYQIIFVRAGLQLSTLSN